MPRPHTGLGTRLKCPRTIKREYSTSIVWFWIRFFAWRAPTSTSDLHIRAIATDNRTTSPTSTVSLNWGGRGGRGRLLAIFLLLFWFFWFPAGCSAGGGGGFSSIGAILLKWAGTTTWGSILSLWAPVCVCVCVCVGGEGQGWHGTSSTVSSF